LWNQSPEAADEYFSTLWVMKGSGGVVGAPPMDIRKWLPKTLAQWAALQSAAYILLFGGAAGSLKYPDARVQLYFRLPRLQSASP
jgi:hypothetical protein